jgi:hypothetical protein
MYIKYFFVDISENIDAIFMQFFFNIKIRISSRHSGYLRSFTNSYRFNYL